jgi:predicted transcriptional regulator
MEVHFSPDVQAKLDQMARDTGRRSDQLVETVVTDFFDDIAFVRETLDRRYDDMESGRVTPIPGEEAFARLRAKERRPESRIYWTKRVANSYRNPLGPSKSKEVQSDANNRA